MADKRTMLGKVLRVTQDGTSVVDSIRDSIRSSQGDGVTLQTKRAMLEAGLIETNKKEQETVAYPAGKQTMTLPAKDATIVMPNGTRITPKQYQKLQEMLLKRGG